MLLFPLNKKLTIYDIKRLTAETAPYYFSSKTLKFFSQTMASFKVYRQADGRYLVTAPMKDKSGRLMGNSERYFNPVNNKLEHS